MVHTDLTDYLSCIEYRQYSVPTKLQVVTHIISKLVILYKKISALGNLKTSFHCARLHYLLG